MPFDLASHYKKDKNWKGLLNFFNKSKYREVEFVDFLYAKKIMRQNKIISKNDYLKFRKNNNIIPSCFVQLHVTV